MVAGRLRVIPKVPSKEVPVVSPVPSLFDILMVCALCKAVAVAALPVQVAAVSAVVAEIAFSVVPKALILLLKVSALSLPKTLFDITKLEISETAKTSFAVV